MGKRKGDRKIPLAREDGGTIGKQEAILLLLEEIEPVSDKLRREIMAETDKETLTN